MTFNELRQNHPVYILDKNTMTYYQGKVVNKGTSRVNTQQGNFMQVQMQMVVDVTIEAEGKTETYTFGENQTAAGVNGKLIATDVHDIVRELKATDAELEEYFAAYDKKKEKQGQCKKLIAELDTDYKDKMLMENEMRTLKEAQKELGDKVDRILTLLSDKDR